MATDPVQLIEEFADAFVRQDVDAIVELYVEDAVYVLAGAGLVAEGREAIREAFAGLLAGAGRVVDFTIDSRSLEVVDDVAYAHMTATARLEQGGETTAVPIRATEVMRRCDDGAWRYVIDHA